MSLNGIVFIGANDIDISFGETKEEKERNLN